MTASESKGSKIFGILFLGFFFFICVGVGAIAIYSGISDIIHTKASLDWPHTDGTVTKSAFKKSKGSSSKGSSGGSVVWYADIEYEYTVDGQPYTHYRVSFGEYGSSDQSHAKAILDRYPVGKTVTVYHKPGEPNEAVLEPEGTMQGIMLKLIVGASFLMFGAIIGLIPLLAPKIKKRLEGRS